MAKQQLDLTTPIVEKGRATSYLEALFYELFAAVNTTPVDVTIASGTATVDLTEGSQFNITATANFVIDVTGVTERVSNRNTINITNPAGAFNLTDINSTGATVYKTAGSSIAITGIDEFMLVVNVPDDDRVVVLPFELETV